MGKGGGKRDQPREVKISKACTQILRHLGARLGLAIRPDGFICVSELLKCKLLVQLNTTEGDLEQVTHSSDKQRFELRSEGGVKYMRAVQGHSMKVIQAEALLRPLLPSDPDLPSKCVHGTYKRHFQSIMDDGLLIGGKRGRDFRQHVHFVPNEPGDAAVISGMRNDCDLAIWVDLRAALLAGMPFFLSKNQVILTAGFDGVVPMRFFHKVRWSDQGRYFVGFDAEL